MGYSLRDKTVVITGAGGGIGRALACRFTSVGARVALLDIDEQAATAVAEELQAERRRALARRCDITVGTDCRAAIAAVEERWGGVDVLINNAGITHLSLFEATEPEVIERVMAVNFHGAVLATQAALPSLLARRGVVVGISSVAGFAPLIGRSGYVASKHALEGFLNTLRAEVAPRGVRVLVVSPGFIDTAISQAALTEDGSRRGEGRKTYGGMLAPEELADAIARAVTRGARDLRPTLLPKLAWWMSHLVPELYEHVMRRREADNFPVIRG